MAEKEDTFQPTVVTIKGRRTAALLEVPSSHTLASLFTASIGCYPRAQHFGRAQGEPDE